MGQRSKDRSVSQNVTLTSARDASDMPNQQQRGGWMNGREKNHICRVVSNVALTFYELKL